MTALPALGFGTFQLTGDDCRHAVETAVEAGYRQATSRDHILDNYASTSLDLDSDDVATIDGIDDTVRLGDPEFAPDW